MTTSPDPRMPNATGRNSGAPAPAAPSAKIVFAAGLAAFRKSGVEGALAYFDALDPVALKRFAAVPPAYKLALLARFALAQCPETALVLANNAIERDVTCVDGWLSAGVAQHRLGLVEGATNALKIVGQSPTAKAQQKVEAGYLLAQLGDHDLGWSVAYPAFVALGRPLAQAPLILYIAQQVAEWPVCDEITQQLSHAYAQGRFDEAGETPRTHLNWCANEAWNAKVIAAHGRRKTPGHGGAPCATTPAPLAGRRLRVAYMSADFREHPMSRWVKGLFRHHDRAQVELFLYCTGVDDGSRLRREVLSTTEHRYSLANLTDADAARLIKSHRIDVLIDLTGATRGSRLNILSYRPAPVQIHYIGLPGTSGSPYVDYVVADDYLVPQSSNPIYPEKLIRLSQTYQVNDYAAILRPAAPTRASQRLPPAPCKVMGMFNGHEKISAQVWDVWMQIMQEAPDAVLWMLDPGPAVQQKLRTRCADSGVDAARLVFAPKVPQAGHLARLALCDVMLDPWPYCGHTTTSDALFMGVPVVTLEGTNFASRVSGSLLRSLGLSRLIAKTIPEYVAMNVGFLTGSDTVAGVETLLGDGGMMSGLYDTATKAQELEAAYRAAYACACRGETPQHIDAARVRLTDFCGSKGEV
ncbi:hypothetical protein [Celeribacter sp.]|uniref:O-linked N-acetylglucosamine transferase, SPINDLY family protein n=1 Tax=Celeribacter sp. TaxID=1890673 RepID=UPI003A8DA216